MLNVWSLGLVELGVAVLFPQKTDDEDKGMGPFPVIQVDLELLSRLLRVVLSIFGDFL